MKVIFIVSGDTGLCVIEDVVTTTMEIQKEFIKMMEIDLGLY